MRKKVPFFVRNDTRASLVACGTTRDVSPLPQNADRPFERLAETRNEERDPWKTRQRRKLSL